MTSHAGLLPPLVQRLTRALAVLVVALWAIAPPALGASALIAKSKRPVCPADKTAKHLKKRTRVTLRTKDERGKVHRKRAWAKRWTWSCVAKPQAVVPPAAKTPDTQAPTAPSAIDAARGDRQITLVWNVSRDNVAVTGYRILRDGLLIATVTSASYTDAGLTNGRTYAYEIIAVDAAGNSSPAGAISAAPAGGSDLTPPSAPPSFAAAGGDRQVSLSWGSSTDNVGVTFYEVARDGSPIAFQAARTFVDAGLTNGTPYHYTVKAFDVSGNGSAMSAASATPADTQAPTVPTGLAATPGNAQVSLLWSVASDNVAVTGYVVYRTSGGSAYTQIATPQTPYFADTGLTNGTAYSYKVVAADGSSNASAQSAAVSATPVAPADTQAPSVPAGLSATAGTNQVSLSWSASTDNTAVTGYRLYRSSGGGAYAQIAAPAGTSFTDTALTNGTGYSYKVAAVDAALNASAQSAAAIATPADTQAPSVPAGLVATAGDAQVALSWSASTDNVAVTGYRVYRSVGGGAYALIASPATAYFTDTGLTNGTVDAYRIAAVDGSANASAQSGAASATPTAPVVSDTQAPTVPASLGATPGVGEVALSWSGSTDDTAVTGYRVYRSSGGGAYTQIAAPASTTYTDTGRTNGTAYSYKVSAIDAAANESAQSAAATATPADTQAPTVPAGLAATAGDAQVALSWSPASDNVAVTGYRVYRSSAGGAYALVASPATPYFTDTGRPNGTAYSYNVSAVDAAANESAQSAAITATPVAPAQVDTQAPSVPAGLTGTPGTNQVSLAWSPASDNVGVTGYKVYRSSGGGAYALAGSPAGPSFVDTGRTNGTAYSYKVSAVDAAANESAQSAVVTVTPGDTQPPTVPTGITLTKNPAAHSITVGWTASTDNVGVVRYRVYRNGTLAGQPTTITFTDPDLANQATYSYTVAAVDAAGNVSAQSPAVSTYVS